MQDILRNMKELTNVHHLAIRKLGDDFRAKTTKFIVSGMGTLESLDELKELVAIKPNMRSGVNSGMAKAAMMADIIYERIHRKPANRSNEAQEFPFDGRKINDIGKAVDWVDPKPIVKRPYVKRGREALSTEARVKPQAKALIMHNEIITEEALDEFFNEYFNSVE
ncbi:hypothetical protein L596_027684 [Steinernema carpocapsae]|nr:hypothetical protein L596_027684 [Steinernema carpocapsae]